MQTAPRTDNEDAALQNELAEWKERCFRFAAESENFKKRTARESDRRAAEQKMAFVRELLPVVDNLERALANGPTQTVEQLR
jgi:molecular chaperone GrpE